MKVKVVDFDMAVHKAKGDGREKTINALKELYEKNKVLGRHDKTGQTYYIVEER